MLLLPDQRAKESTILPSLARPKGCRSKEETVMQTIRWRVGAICGVSAFVFVTVFFFAPAHAQQRCKVDETIPAKNTTYTEQHVMDVGDVPGHQIRIAEVRTTFPDDKANCEGLKRTESVVRILTDYVDRNGTLHGYGVTTFENGDKIFAVTDGISQTVTNADGSKSSTFFGVSRYTGGTGKYHNVRGLFRATNAFDPAKNYNQGHTEGEYWIEK
jgi:hypothetical protein